MVRQQANSASSKNLQRRLSLWAGAAGVYLIPVGLKVGSGKLNWGTEDFVFAAVLIFAPVLTYDLTTRGVFSRYYKYGMALALLGTCFLLWSAASVGIIGASSEPANYLYLIVVLVGVTGGYVSQLEPDGLARSMLTMAMVQAAITGAAIVFQRGQQASGPLELMAINGFFLTVWIAAAWLFWKAARELGDALASQEDMHHV